MTLKTIIIGVVTICIGIFLIKGCGENKLTNKGYVIPWQDVEYTYKKYNGKRSIDSKAFNNIVMKKNELGMCRYLYTQYKDYDNQTIQKLIASKDTDAMIEQMSRFYHNDFLNYSDTSEMNKYDDQISFDIKLANKHIISKITWDITLININIEYDLNALLNPNKKQRESYKLLEQYAEITPYAIGIHLLALSETYNKNKNDALKNIILEKAKRIQQAGGYHYGMALGTKIELELTGKTDNDVFCEAYFNGCNLYDMKNKYKIKC